VVKNNIIANAGASGIQARGGATVTDNLFLSNPVDLLVGTSEPVDSGGVPAKIVDNVFLGSRNIGSLARGWAIEVDNLKAGAGNRIAGNIIANDNVNNFAAIKLQVGSGAANDQYGVGINDLTIEDNIVFNWREGMSLAPTLQPGVKGPKGLNGLVVRDNDFQSPTSSRIVNHASPFDASAERWSNNRYFDDSASSGWFTVGTTKTSMDAWKSKVEPSAKAQKMDYPDPDRSIASYNASLGGASSMTAFLQKARDQSKSSWKPQFTATAANSYVRAGFTGATPSGVDPDPAPPPSPTPPPTPPTPPPPSVPSATSGAPTPTLLDVADRTMAGAGEQLIQVRYVDDVGVDVSTFGNSDVHVSGPNGYEANATFVSADSTSDGPVRTATYKIAAPGASWDKADNGTYTISMNAKGVSDHVGIWIPPQVLGTMSVNVA
jgi:hypothetical protein